MADDAVGVGQDGIMPRQGGEDVRFDLQPAAGFVEQDASQNPQNGDDQRPAESVAFKKLHRLHCLSASCSGHAAAE